MTSLAEAYEENVGEVGSLRRLYLGVGLFVVGALLVVVGIVVSTTNIYATFGLRWWHAREIGGVLAGLGVPAVFVGVFTVLPASQRVRAAAAIGAGIVVFGVALFADAYPKDWAGYGADHTARVAAVYFLGVLVTLWCLFVAVVNFKTRNDPGGTVTLEITREGEVRTVEVERDELDDLGANDFGGVAFLGETPDGETPTQTNQLGGATATSDGGVTTDDIRSPLDDAPAGPSPQRTTDAYCGNCEYFEYVRTNEGMKPRCGYFGRTMDDMDACEEWQPNS